MAVLRAWQSPTVTLRGLKRTSPSIRFRARGSSARMSSHFRVVRHIVNCQHTREYPAATANGDDDVPKLAVKQYIPLDNPSPQHGDVTIIAAHANGFPKVRWIIPDETQGLHPYQRGRSCTNLSGTRFMRGLGTTVSVFGAYRLPTFGTRANPDCLMRESWATIARPSASFFEDGTDMIQPVGSTIRET